MLRISVYAKGNDELVRTFEALDIHKTLDIMSNDYGEDHSDHYEIGIEMIQKGISD